MTHKFLLSAALLMAGTAFAPVSHAAKLTKEQTRQRMAQQTEAFKWAPKSKAAQAEWQNLSNTAAKGQRAGVKTEADVSLTPSENTTYLDMPDGTTWFVTTEFDKTVISQSDSYTQYKYNGVKATVYNDKYEPVGKIDYTFDVPEGMDFCSNVQFGAAVTKKFFNTNDNYEVMLMANYKPKNDYGAVPFTYVFSLKGAQENATYLTTYPGYYVSAINNATDKWSEDFFMEFFTGEEYTDTEMLYTFDILSKASYSSPLPQKLQSFTVDMVYVMSDGENEPLPVLINSKGNTLYATVSRYEKTFFEDPFDYTNEKLSPDNKYKIELYKKGAWDKELKLQNTIEVPCEDPIENFAMRSYSLGFFSGNGDITFDFTATEPALILSLLDSDMYENQYSQYRVINTAGETIKTFGEGNEGYYLLGSVKGYPEQYCFLMPEEDNTYSYTFYDYPSMEKKASVPTVLLHEGYNVTLSLMLDRVADNGAYSYAIASVGGSTDDEGNTYHLVAWFDKDGKETKVDHLVAGKNVNLISPYVSNNALSRYLFNTDEAREYMMFAQRLNQVGQSTAHTELMVVNDRGDALVQYPFDTFDSQINVALVNLNTNPAIWITFEDADDHKIKSEFIKLPLNDFEGEGTVENPYLLKTIGDVERMPFYLTGNFRLANDIDWQGAEFTPLAGNFTGSIDGAGHTLKNFVLKDKAMFSAFGRLGSEINSFIKDLKIKNVTTTNAPAVLVESAYATRLENIHATGIKATGEDNDFGTLVGTATTTEITLCGVMADINIPEGDEVGGLVSTLSKGSSVVASSFNGTITGASSVAGIAAFAQTESSITDCHVTATLTAENTVGGIVGRSARATINRCVVEGEITATQPANAWSDYAGGPVKNINAGGVAGWLESPAVEYDGNGNPKPADPNAPAVITGCLVALDAINIPADDKEALLATAHRIVGRSSVNDDPAYLGEDPTTWEIIWGDPAAAESGIKDNYVVGSLPVLQATVEAKATTTEGATVDDLDDTLLTSLGYQFNGYDATSPWSFGTSVVPALFFEATLGQSLEFQPAAITGKPGDEVSVLLVLERVDFEALTIESSDESGCTVEPVEYDEDGNVVIAVTLIKAGTYTVTASNGSINAVLTVTCIEEAGIDNISGADNANLPVIYYNLQGMRIDAPQPGQVVIRVQGTDVRKEIIR